MKSVLIAIKPYWVFLIIAKTMGWDYSQEKTIEIRKTFPKDEDWDKTVNIYCTKDKASFKQIPKEYQPLMEKFLGKVVGEFVCNEITEHTPDINHYMYYVDDDTLKNACLTADKSWQYGKGRPLHAWHISDLKVHDKPKELSNFYNKHCNYFYNGCCCCTEFCQWQECLQEGAMLCVKSLTRAPQSWCYVEGVAV